MSRRRASDAVWNTRNPLNFERYDPREPTGALTVFGGKAIIGGTFGLLCMALFSSWKPRESATRSLLTSTGRLVRRRPYL